MTPHAAEPRPTRKLIAGPWFDELRVGQRLAGAPAMTITTGHASLHQAIVGDRLRLALDQPLCEAVTGRQGVLVHPNLACDLAIGQSTMATGRVMANLFYRDLVLQRAPSVNDTLHTTTTVVAMKENRSLTAGRATGLAVLKIESRDQLGREVLNFERCAMLPVSEPGAASWAADEVLSAGSDRSLDGLDLVTGGWDLRQFREAVGGEDEPPLRVGDGYEVETADVVTSAPELVHLSLNLAAAHSDVRVTGGKRLVYGGHTIGIAASHLSRALPNLVYVPAWLGCDHVGPVYEGDTLSSVVEIEATEPRAGGGTLAALRVMVDAHRDGGEARVLDWRLVAVLA